MRRVLRGDEARRAIGRGVDVLADAVVCTLGPKGRCVILEKHPHWPPRVTKDGVTVAKEVRDLEDPFENIGANLIREAASQTSNVAGDGTTTATLLARDMYAQGSMLLQNGANPQALKRGMDAAASIVADEIALHAHKVDDSETISRIGTISCNGDRQIGEMIAEAMEKVGRDGVILPVESADAQMHLKIVEGMQIDRGFVAFPFVENAERLETVLDNARILITERKLYTVQPDSALDNTLASLGKDGVPVLIIAGDFDQPFVITLIHNKGRGQLRSVPVKAMGFGDLRRSILEDIAIVTGGYAFTEDCGRTLDEITLDDLGTAERVTIRGHDANGTTTIAGGAGIDGRKVSRIELLKSLIDATENDLERARLKERLARLVSGVAMIRVGAVTEAERDEKRDRVDDAVCATKAAVLEGIVPGGGLALMQTWDALRNRLEEMDLSEEERQGAQIVARALSAPFKQIAENAGEAVEELYTRQRQLITTTPDMGFNAATGEWVNMIEAGIIDPARVVRCALQNAVSVASTLLLTECSVCTIPERRP